jgi:hypothetical protein
MTKKKVLELAQAHGITIEVQEVEHDYEAWYDVNLPAGFTYHGCTGLSGTYYRSKRDKWTLIGQDVRELVANKNLWQQV